MDYYKIYTAVLMPCLTAIFNKVVLDSTSLSETLRATITTLFKPGKVQPRQEIPSNIPPKPWSENNNILSTL